MWADRFEDLLVEWVELRSKAVELPLDEALLLVQDWWDRAPIVNNTVHFTDTENWPGPWDLLAYGAYCDVAKCLGICLAIFNALFEPANKGSLAKLKT